MLLGNMYFIIITNSNKHLYFFANTYLALVRPDKKRYIFILKFDTLILGTTYRH